MLHITRRQDATSNTLPLRPGPQSYNNNTQRVSERAENERASKRKASIQTTTNSKATSPPKQKQNKNPFHSERQPSRGISCRTEAPREVEPGVAVGHKGHPLFQPRHHPTYPRPDLPYMTSGRRPPRPGPGPGALSCVAGRRSARRWDLRASCAARLCLMRRFFVTPVTVGMSTATEECVSSAATGALAPMSTAIPASAVEAPWSTAIVSSVTPSVVTADPSVATPAACRPPYRHRQPRRRRHVRRQQ